MKILHALVGYLAATAQRPFHSFAFASPLAAINYDGYVNTTTTQNRIDGALMEHVLNSIVQPCQNAAYHSVYANTTQNHGDSALMKRVPGDIIKARQWVAVTPAFIAIDVIFAAVAISLFWIEEDDPKREAFTQDTITQSITKYPSFNWVICHSPYSVSFNGVEGTDWGTSHYELGISFGRTIGYDLYWATSGTFYRYGDGGFINWAYNGNILGTDNGGATVYFGTIS